MSHMGGYALRLSFIWPHSKSMHRHGLGNLVYPTAQYLCHRSGNHPLCTPMREGPPGGGPSLIVLRGGAQKFPMPWTNARLWIGVGQNSQAYQHTELLTLFLSVPHAR